MWGLICPFPQGKSCFGVALVQAWAAYQLWWSRSHFGGMPVEAGRLDTWVHKRKGSNCGACKVGGKCWHWFPQVYGYVGPERGREMALPCTFVSRGISCRSLPLLLAS